MICKNCGTEFMTGIFCPECGTKNIDEKQAQIEKEKAEAERKAKEKAEQERIAKEKAEAERKAKEKAEQERIAKEKAEAERKAKEKAEKERIAKEKVEAERKAKEKAEQERMAKEKAEAERKAKEKAEKERIDKEKAEAEARVAKERALIEKIEKEKRELAARTYKNVVYSSETEARLAREEDNKIESLKQKLLTTKDQKVRRQMFSEFKDNIQTTEAKKRYELLKLKVNQEKPKAIKFNLMYGISIIVAIIVTAVLGVAGLLDGVWELIIGFAGLWYGIGIPVWIIWKIVLLAQSKGKNYYLNIRHI